VIRIKKKILPFVALLIVICFAQSGSVLSLDMSNWTYYKQINITATNIGTTELNEYVADVNITGLKNKPSLRLIYNDATEIPYNLVEYGTDWARVFFIVENIQNDTANYNYKAYYGNPALTSWKDYGSEAPIRIWIDYTYDVATYRSWGWTADYGCNDREDRAIIDTSGVGYRYGTGSTSGAEMYWNLSAMYSNATIDWGHNKTGISFYKRKITSSEAYDYFGVNPTSAFCSTKFINSAFYGTDYKMRQTSDYNALYQSTDLLPGSTADGTFEYGVAYYNNGSATDIQESYFKSSSNFLYVLNFTSGDYWSNLTNYDGAYMVWEHSREGNDWTDNFYIQSTKGLFYGLHPTITLGAEQTLSSPPSINSLEWTDNNGQVNQTSYFLNRFLDSIEINVTDSDADLDTVTLRVTYPNSSYAVNSNLSSATDIFSYGTDITLDKLGNWLINVTACDLESSCTSTQSTITVSNTPQGISTNSIYGYVFNSRDPPYESILINETCFITADNHSYKTIVAADHADEWFNAGQWQEFINNLTVYPDLYNTKVSLSIDLSNENLTEGSSDSSTIITFIGSNFADLLNLEVIGRVSYIELYLGAGQSATGIDSTVNDIAGKIVEETNNQYPVYVSTEHESGASFSGLDTSVARNITNFIRYLNFTQRLTEDGLYYKLLDKGGISTNNYIVYDSDSAQVNISQHSVFSSWHDTFIDHLRGTYEGTVFDSGSNQTYWTFSNGDRLLYNYHTTDTNISFTCTNGTSIFDRVNKEILEKTTPDSGNCSLVIKASGDQARLIGFVSIKSPIELSNTTSATIYGTTDSYTNQKVTFHNDSIWADGSPSSWQVKGGNDVKIRILEYGFKKPVLNIFYGQYLSIYMGDYKGLLDPDRLVQIVAGNNYTGRDGNITAHVNAISSLGYSTKLCPYDSLADYNDSDDWETSHESKIDEFYNLGARCVYEDGWDYGAGGPNFATRTSNVINHARNKNMTVACNTYTTYRDVTPLCDILTTESVVCTWNGTAPNYNYYTNSWSVDVDKAQWFQSYDADVYGVFFVPRDNYTYAYDCWAGCKVLGYDDCYADQPDFDGSYPQDQQRYPDLGSMLQTDWYQSGSEYCREYEKGTVCYNPNEHEGRIIWSRNTTIDSVCMRIYDLDDLDSGDVAFKINEGTRTYLIDQDGAPNYVWHTACNDSSALLEEEANEYGVYEIRAWHSDRAGGGQGFSLANAITRGTGVNSWWDTTGDPNTFNAYSEGQQWLVYVNFSSTTETVLDENAPITQTEVTSGKTILLTLSSANEYDFPVQSYPITISTGITDITYNGVSLNWSAAGYVNTIDGENHTVTYNNSILTIITPHLSNQTYNITLNNTAPETTTPSISPSTLYPNTDAVCSTDYTDADNDNGTVSFKWFINSVYAYALNDTGVTNGSSSYSILLSGNYSMNDNITCSVRAYDGTSYEASWENVTKTVQNPPPVVVPRISPSDPKTADDLIGYCNGTDPNGDNLTYYEKWFLNDRAYKNFPFSVNETASAGLTAGKVSSTGAFLNYTYSSQWSSIVYFNYSLRMTGKQQYQNISVYNYSAGDWLRILSISRTWLAQDILGINQTALGVNASNPLRIKIEKEAIGETTYLDHHDLIYYTHIYHNADPVENDTESNSAWVPQGCSYSDTDESGATDEDWDSYSQGGMVYENVTIPSGIDYASWQFKSYTFNENITIDCYTGTSWVNIYNGELWGTDTVTLPQSCISGTILQIRTNATLSGTYCSGGIGIGTYVKYFEGKALFYFTSYVSGQEVQLSTVSSGNTVKTENWTYSCMAYDGIHNGTWVNTTVNIRNRIPSISTARISPTSLNVDSSNIMGYATVSDNDTGDRHIIHYQWLKNGILLESGYLGGDTSLTRDSTPDAVSCDGSWNGDCSNLYDGDMSTLDYSTAGEAIFYANFSKESYTKRESSMLSVKDHNAAYNLTIPSDCWSQDPLRFQVISSKITTLTLYKCWDGSSWEILKAGSSHVVYEINMLWNKSIGTQNVTDMNIDNLTGYLHSVNDQITLRYLAYDGMANSSWYSVTETVRDTGDLSGRDSEGDTGGDTSDENEDNLSEPVDIDPDNPPDIEEGSVDLTTKKSELSGSSTSSILTAEGLSGNFLWIGLGTAIIVILVIGILFIFILSRW